ERFRGLQVDNKLVLGRRLHRQIGRLFAFEDAIDVAGRAPELIDKIRPIGDQAAGVDEDTIVVDPRQLVAGRQVDDQVAMKPYPAAAGHDLAANRSARKGRDSGMDLSDAAHIERNDLYNYGRDS